MKHLFAWGIASILAFMAIGCGHSIEQELGTTDLATPHVYTNPTGDEFPILAWYSLLGDQVTKERYEEMAEAGFNISFSHFGTIEQVEQALELSQGTGVKILITCGEMYNDTENTFPSPPTKCGLLPA